MESWKKCTFDPKASDVMLEFLIYRTWAVYIYYPGDIFIWHELLFCHLPAISSLPFAKKVPNLTYVYVFLLVLLTLIDLSGTMLFISIMIDN